MTRTDPFELFKALNPLHDDPATDPGAVDEELLARIVAEPRTVGPSRPSRRRLWVVAGTVAVAGLATAAFAVLRTSSPTEPTAITCAATSDPAGDVVGLAGAPDPVAACAELWANGTLGTGTVPPLAACVNDAGAAIVLPGDPTTVCSRAGFDLLDQDADNTAALSILDLEAELIDTFLNDCYGQDDALAETRRTLDDNGYLDWTVTLAEDFPDGIDCAGIGIDASNQTVIVAGVRPE